MRFPLVAFAATALGLASAPALAQTQQYDADCKPLPNPPVADDFEQFRGEIIRSYLPVGAGFIIADKVCQGKNYIDRLLKRQPDPSQVTLADAMDAAKPEVSPRISAEEHYAQEREAERRLKARAEERRRAYLRSNPADEAVAAANAREEEARLAGYPATRAFLPGDAPPGGMIVLPPRNPGGFIAIFEGRASGANGKAPASVGEINGEGVLYDSDGLSEGGFKAGKLEGEGQQLTADGTWRGGNYRNDQLEGPGWEVSQRGGKVVAMDGTFLGDKPDGEMVVRYADGSSRRQLWRDGRMLREGALGPPGAAPPRLPNPDAPWDKGARYRVASNSDTWLNVAEIGGKTYLVSQTWDGKRDGMMQRVFADGTVQYEEWQGGQLVQTGSRGSYATTVAPRGAGGAIVARGPAPAAPVTRPVSSGGASFSSVCARNQSKLRAYISRAGGITWGARIHSEYMRMWSQCRASDPEAEREYQENARFLSNYQRRGNPDGSSEGFLQELRRAISDPNYSAELGSARGGGGPATAVADNRSAQPRPAPRSSVGQFDVPNPVLPASFYSRYTARGLPLDTVAAQSNSDPIVTRMLALANNGSDTHARMKYLIAQLEGMIVIFRQSADEPGARERIEGLLRSREATVKNCQAIASDPGDCTRPVM